MVLPNTIPIPTSGRIHADVAWVPAQRNMGQAPSRKFKAAQASVTKCIPRDNQQGSSHDVHLRVGVEVWPNFCIAAGANGCYSRVGVEEAVLEDLYEVGLRSPLRHHPYVQPRRSQLGLVADLDAWGARTMQPR